jgi:cytochrome c-type biogenesis protein CcmH/NrfF
VAALAVLNAMGLEVDPRQFDLAAGTIRCDCGCHPQSVKECACGRAEQMRDEVRALLARGMTGEQVIAHYVAEQGEQILLAPKATGFNLVAWLGPLVGLFGGVLGLALVLSRWRRTAPAAAPPAEPLPPAEPDGEYRERLREALERLR